jgi:hypothetical protein
MGSVMGLEKLMAEIEVLKDILELLLLLLKDEE